MLYIISKNSLTRLTIHFLIALSKPAGFLPGITNTKYIFGVHTRINTLSRDLFSYKIYESNYQVRSKIDPCIVMIL